MRIRNYVCRAMIFVAVGAMAALSGCNSTDPLPAPVSGFEIITPITEVGIPVKFSNLSTNSATYLWDFGDGTDSTSMIAPEHTYLDPGTYTVSLTATTEDNQTSTETKDITVGERHLIELDVLTFSNVDDQGVPWNEDGSPPNAVMIFGPATEVNAFLNGTSSDLPNTYISPVIDSIGVDPNAPPLFIPLQDQDVITLTNEDFIFAILNVVSDTDISVLDGIQFNPITSLPFTLISENDKVSYFSAAFRGFTFDFVYQVE